MVQGHFMSGVGASNLLILRERNS